MGELVSMGKMGVLGEISPSESDDYSDDPRKPVRQFMHMEGFKFANSDLYSLRLLNTIFSTTYTRRAVISSRF